jgi:hypothetical protein
MKSNEAARAQSISRALESANQGRMDAEERWRHAFGIPGGSTGLCDGSSDCGCEVCEELGAAKTSTRCIVSTRRPGRPSKEGK